MKHPCSGGCEKGENFTPGKRKSDGEEYVTIKVYLKDFEAIPKKYRQLGREIGLSDSNNRSDMEHSHSKLGCFLEDLFGSELWRRF